MKKYLEVKVGNDDAYGMYCENSEELARAVVREIGESTVSVMIRKAEDRAPASCGQSNCEDVEDSGDES